MNREKLIKAANELNTEMGLEPAIDLSQSIDELKKALRKASKMIAPDDELTAETLDTLKQLGILLILKSKPL